MNLFKSIGLYAAVAALILGLFAGWSIRDWKADSDTLAAVAKGDKAEVAMERIVGAASAKFEQFQAVEAPAAIQRRDTIREIYRDIKIPVECAVPSELVRLLTDARQRANAATTGQPVAAVSDNSATPIPTVGP